jgi:hypothetical protein
MRGFFIGLLVLVVVLVGGGLIATAAYQAGLSQAVTTVVQTGTDPATGTAVTPVVVPAYGYGYGWHGFGWGPGFGFFGILFGIFFLFLIFGMLRAAFGRGRGWGGPGGWGGPSGWGGPGPRGFYGEGRVHDTFEQWHREAHEGNGPPDASGDQPSKPA